MQPTEKQSNILNRALASRLASVVFIAALWTNSLACLANSDLQTEQELEKLENKFFSQTYKSDSDEARVGRLEEMLFGHALHGPVDARFAAVVNALDSIKKSAGAQTSAASGPVSQPSNDSNNGPNHLQYFDDGQREGESPTAGAGWPERSPIRHSDWEDSEQPRSSTTEMDDTPDIIDVNMGMNAGMSSGDMNMSGLDSAGMSTGGGMTMSQPTMSAMNAPLFAKKKGRRTKSPPSAANSTMTGKLATMEKQVFGKDSPRLPLLVRVKRLEQDVLPNDKEASQQALPDRVAKLWSSLGDQQVAAEGVSAPNTTNFYGQSPGSQNSALGFNEYSDKYSTGYSGGTQSAPMQSQLVFTDSQPKPSLLQKIGQAIGQASAGMISGGSMNPYGFGNPYGYPGLSPYGYSPGFTPYAGTYPGLLGGSYPGMLTGTYPGVFGGGPFGGGYPGSSPFGWANNPFAPYGFGSGYPGAGFQMVNPYSRGGNLYSHGLTRL